jgi:hypothetical protein
VRAAIRHSGTQGRSIPLLAIEMLGRAFSCGMPEKTRNNRIHCTAPVPGIRVPQVMYGRPPLGKGFFSAVQQTVGSGHVSGLFARCIDRWP